jgi:hypothetical protein
MSSDTSKVFKSAGNEKFRSMSSAKSRLLSYAKGQQIRASTKSEEPAEYFQAMLSARGYNTDEMWIDGLHSRYCIQPSSKQKGDYDSHSIDATRKNDTATLSTLLVLGRSMNACNSHSESLLHLACRKSSVAVISFIVDNLETAMVDDFGRTPLHDVCWRCIPNFDVARVVLDFDPELMLVRDKYGAIPLKYVPPSQWSRWCEFLDRVKDVYWPPMNEYQQGLTSSEDDYHDFADDLILPPAPQHLSEGQISQISQETEAVSSIIEI